MDINSQEFKRFNEALQNLSRVLHTSITRMDAKKAKYERVKRGAIDMAKLRPTQTSRLHCIEELTRIGLKLTLDEELEIFFDSTSDAEGQA